MILDIEVYRFCVEHIFDFRTHIEKESVNLEVPGKRGAGSLAPAVVTLSFSIPVVLGIAWTVVARRRASRPGNVGPGPARDTLRRFAETIAVRSHARVPAYGVELKSIAAERGYE